MSLSKFQLAEKPLLSAVIIASITVSVLVAISMMDSAGTASAKVSSKGDRDRVGPIANFDIRLSGKALSDKLNKTPLTDVESLIEQTADGNRVSIEAAVDKLRRVYPDVEITGSPLTGAVEVLRSARGMTAPSDLSGEEIVARFISKNRAIYGLSEGDVANLNFIGESVSPNSGLRMVRVEQVLNGRPIFQSETRFILDRDGRIIRSLGLMVPKGDATTVEMLSGLMSAPQALQRTMADLRVDLDLSNVKVVALEEAGYSTKMMVDNPSIGGRVTSEIVYFPLAPGVLVPAWSQVVFGVDHDWYVLVDARDGALLWRKNIRSDASTHDARFRVYVQSDGITPADNPAPQSPSAAVVGAGTQFPEIVPTLVSMFLAQNLTASPNGWIDDCPGGICGATESQTLGNNALACVDRTAGGSNVCDTAGVSLLDGNGRPTGNPDVNGRNRDFLGTAPRDFETNFLPAPVGGNPEAGQTSTSTLAGIESFLRASVVQQFYVTNWYHDRLYLLGFDTAAGNFQNNIFGGGGVGNDRVLVDVQDGQANNNANFSTPPDGTSGRAQMFNFTGPTIDRDGGLDAEILIHELTHGTSNRIIGNAAGLQWDIGRGMGEGWSDFYALSLLNNMPGDNPDGRYANGAYATYKAFGVVGYLDNYVYGIRRFPYSTDNAVNPMTWADVDQTTNNLSGGIAADPLGFNFGGAGQVHNVGEIWGLSLWEVRSRIIAANGGNVATGNQISLQLVTDAMKMTPANPSYLQARDALIDADCATNACANEESIWNGFADRGLGYGARVPNRVSFTPRAPHIGVVESFLPANLDINTIAITDTVGNNSGFVDPSEPFRFEINIKNPWRNAGKTATGVSATVSSSTPGVQIINATTTYPNIGPNANADRNAFNMVARAPVGGTCGAAMQFTLTITSSLGSVARNFSLRMGQPSGTLAPVTYTRSGLGLAIQDNAPVGTADSLSVPDDYEIADLDVRIDSITHAFTGDLTFSVKGPNGYSTDFLAFLGGAVGGGGNGDNIVNMLFDDEALGDVLLAPNTSAPFTGSWKPVFNSPTWTLVGFPGPDAVPQLTNYDGSSSLGTWTAIASDQGAIDAGVFNGWSLIVTPRNFVCAPFAPTAANVTVAGRVVDTEGRGLFNVVLTITNSTGSTLTTRSNPLGYFQFDDVPPGQTYLLNAQSKRYSFESQVLTVQDDITDLVVTAQ